MGGLSTDSSEGSAPHYEVFVALKGLRNLSEENRDKVNGRQGQDMIECPPHSAHCPECRGEVGDGRRSSLELWEGRVEPHRHTCTHETSSHAHPGHSRARLTHMPPSLTPASLEPFCSQLDHCLQETSTRYKYLRFRGSMGPAQVHLVGQGAFRELRAALAACPSAPFPPEMPRVLRYRPLAQCLQRRVVS